MTQLFVNNFSATVAQTFGSADTFLYLNSVAGLPALTGGDYLLLTLFRKVGIVESGHEVVKVTAITDLMLTVERSVEGAAASVFNVGALVEMRVTAGALSLKADATDVTAHTTDTANPHAVTAVQVGLGNVDNTSDVDKPVSTAQATAIGLKLDASAAYVHPTEHPPSIITQDASNRFVTDAEKAIWDAKQAVLVSGTSIKTISGTSLLGSGDIAVEASLLRVARTSNTALTLSDKSKLIDITSGTFTQTFDAAASLGDGWSVYIRNSGTGIITLDPNGTELINGAATYTLPPGTAMLLQCDGTTLRTVTVGPTQLIRYKIFDNDTNGMMPASVLEGITPPTFAVGYGSGNYASYVIVYGNGLFIAPSTSSQSTIGTSPDGETWTLRTMPSSQSWKVGTNGSNKFIAVCNTTATATSTNGTAWTAGTSLPANAHLTNGTPAYNAGVWCVFGTPANTNFVSTDDGATWSAAQTLPTAQGTRPFVIGGLFWFMPSGGSTAYTSATGLTGSWTARTLPISPSSSYLTMQTNGKLAIAEQVTGADVYETTDGINWTLADYKAGYSGMMPYLLNGVCVTYQAILGRCSTYANGTSTLRSSNIDAAYQFQAILVGTRFVAPAFIVGGYVISIDTTNMPQTALFTR